ncbi:MAG: rod shape-determining protein RodA [Acidobacteriota bacterium]|nr:rod shape-determining protein RodA [Acidobacteriota bacterium]
MIEQRLYRHIDWLLLGALLLLCIAGVTMIYSTTYDPTTGGTSAFVSRQLWALALGLLAFIITLSFDYRWFSDSSLAIFVGLLGLVAYTLLFGAAGGGARRWIDLGAFNLQPSEFARTVVALVLATIFAQRRWGALTASGWISTVLVVGLPFVLIAQQPDLGTAVTLLPVALAILLFAGLPLRYVGVLMVVAGLSAPVAWAYGLEDYQKQRISSFLDPEQDARGAGYQQIQAKITVGSGGPLGKGFLKGTQSQYNFLPVAHNDFIFSVLAEEHGFLGVVVTLGLYLFVILRGLDAARLAKDRLGTYLVVGIMSGFTFQVVYNIAMSAGLAPVKGLTLPLISYGGSSVIATLAAFGFVLNVRMRRFTN